MLDLQALKQRVPEYGKDIKVNLSLVLSEEGAPGLSQVQVDLVALASAYASRVAVVSDAMQAEVRARLSEAQPNAVKAAVTVMAMNNVYYRFVHLVSNKEFGKMAAGLRMTVIGNPGIPKIDFELMCFAVSSINGCGMCMDAHAHEAIKAGVLNEGVQSVIRIAAVVHAAAQVAFNEGLHVE